MSEDTPNVAEVFSENMRKIARFSPGAVRRLVGGSSGAGMGAVAGGAVGAAGGAYKGYQDAKEQGEGTGRAALHGLFGGVGGGLTGAAVGGVAGSAAGAIAPDKAQALAKIPGLGAASRFGQRQMHGMTGALSKEELRGVRGGAYDAQQAHSAAKDALRGAAPKDKAKLKARARDTHAEYKSIEKAEDMGLTSLPGYAKSLKDNGVRKTVSTGFRAQWDGTPAWQKGVTIGLPAYGAVSSAREQEDPENPHRARAVMGGLADAAAGAVMPFATVPGMVAGAVAGGAGRLAGRGVDRLRRKKNVPVPARETSTDPTRSQSQMAIDRQESPSAMGRAPDLGIT